MVSLLQDDDATGEMPQQQFRQRLTQEILVQTQQQWVAPGVYRKQLAMSLQLMEKLVAIHDPGHLALTLINQRLQHLLNTESRAHCITQCLSCFMKNSSPVVPERESTDAAWADSSGG